MQSQRLKRKRKLEARKQDLESFDDLLVRLARTERDVEEIGGWLDTDGAADLAGHVQEKREELNKSSEERKARFDDRS